MTVYLKLDRPTIEMLMKRFGVQGVTRFSCLHGGWSNTSYLVEIELKKFVLTVCDQMSVPATNRLASLLLYLETHGLRTSQLIPTAKGSSLTTFKDKPVFLKSYLSGGISENLSEEMLVDLGEEIGRLHRIPAPDSLPSSFSYGIQSFGEVIDSGLSHPFVKWLEESRKFLDLKMPKLLPKCLIHGDIFADNVIISAGTVTLADFEEACCYYRVFDLGMALVGCCRMQGRISFKKAASLVSGYQKKVKLQQDEIESLKVFTFYGAVATSFWRFRQYHMVRPDPLLCDRHLEMQQLADRIAGYDSACFSELFEI